MLVKGLGYLDEAQTEIKEKKDTTALVLINQGKTLFDEVRVRVEGFLRERTEEQYKVEVQKLLQSASLLINAGRHLGNATFYIEAEESEKFITLLNQANEYKNTARQLVEQVQLFVDGTQP